MISEAQIREALRIILKSPTPDKWDLEYDFLESDLDSLDHANLALHIEENFSIFISDEDLPSLRSMQHVIDYCNKKLKTTA